MTRTTSLAQRRFELMAAEYLERMGARIASRREELGLTQEDVAREMPGRVTGARVSLWERGKHRPRDDSLDALARVLQVDVSYFMASTPDKSNGTPDVLGVDQSVEARLDRLEETLSEALQILRRLARREDLAPPGELGRRARDPQPMSQDREAARHRRAGDASPGNA